MLNLAQELRINLRSLIKSSVFTLAVLTILALGIGATTAVFSLVSALLLRQLPYRDSDRLMTLSFPSEKRGARGDSFSWERLRFLRENHQSFEFISAWVADTVNLTGSGEPEQLTVARVSADFFRVMGAQPLLGRDLLEGEDEPGAKPVVIISHDLWQRHFGESRDVVGRAINLDSITYTVVGVMPSTFHYPTRNSMLWIPRPYELSFLSQAEIRIGAAYLSGIGKLRRGVSPKQAQAGVETGNKQYVTQFRSLLDADPDAHVRLTPLRDKILGDVSTTILTLFAAVSFVLLIVCANIAALILARATARSKELAIRVALGASRGRLLWMTLSESVMLSLTGGVLGVLLASYSIKGLTTFFEKQLPRAEEIRIDSPVLLFALFVSALTGVISGLFPALQASRPDLNKLLRDANWGSTGGPAGRRSRNWLVIGQVAVSMVLLIGAGLMLRSFLRLNTVDPGFDPARLIAIRLNFSLDRYPDADKRRVYAKEILRQVQEIPGLRFAALGFTVPLTDPIRVPVQIEGRAILSPNERPVVQFQSISPAYFETMRIPLKEGRLFTEYDTETVAPLVIVSEKMARRFWPDESSLGKRLLLPDGKSREVVGVVRDIKNTSLRDEPQEQLYVPYLQFPFPKVAVMARIDADSRQMITTVKQRIQNADRDQSILEARTMEEILSENTGQVRLLLFLLAAFSGAAIILAMVGLYGVLAYSVTQRTKELAVRMALGSNRREILGMVLKQGERLVIYGVLFGAIASLFMTRLLGSFLYQVDATDPLVFIIVSFGLIAIGALASIVPAYRACSVDPIRALRDV